MKRYIGYAYYVLCLLASLLISCNNESDGIPTGTIYLNVEEDASLLTKTETAVTNQSLRVDIISADEDTIRSYSDYLEEVKGKKIVIPAGTYTVAISSNQSEEAGWEKPFYFGSEEIVVKKDEITAAQIVCKIANAKVTVEYEKSLADYFSNYETTVSNSSGSLLYTRDEYRAGYFKAEKLTTKLRLINKDGNEFSLQRIFPDIQEQYFYKIKFALDNGGDDNQAGGDFGGITIEEKADTIYYGIYIKDEDLFGKSIPTMKLEGFENNKITYTKTDDPKIPEHSLAIKAANGFKQLRIEVVSFQFSDMLSFDLCNLTSVERMRLESLNFPIPDVTNKKEITLSLMDFAKSLGTSSETLAETHSFKIYALDNLHQEKDITFAYEVRPDIAAYVENPRCWSSFAVLKGYCIDASAYFKFQTKEGEVIDIKTVVRDADGNISALVTGLASKTVYNYWLVSETNTEMKCEPVQFELTAPMDVPNIGFDSWTNKTKGYLDAPIVGGNKEYISPNADASNVYWDSGNLGAIAAKEVLTESTTITINSASDKAGARLCTKYPNVAGMGAFAAGSIYSGRPTSVSSSGAVLEYGRAYQGFPIKLRGYYKYEPKPIDNTDSRCPVQGLNGKMDQGIIYIALIPKTFEVISKTSGNIVAFSKVSANAFAYGEYVITGTKNETGKEEEGLLNGYVPFEITLKYDNAIPRTEQFYIVIVASASRYGDFFTGAVGSTLYVDEFSLDYNFDAEAFSQTGLKSMTPVNINE